MDKNTTIASIKNQDERVVQRIYKEFKPKFENWIRGRYKISNAEDCSEIYQRSFTVLFFNIKKDKLVDLEASLETYLYGIGKMIIREWWRDKSPQKEMDSLNENTDLENVSLFSEVFEKSAIDEATSDKLIQALEEIGEPCKTIIKLFYWERNSMEAIAIKTGYKNDASAKKKKYLCLAKLRELMNR
ncbi:RNA polymerase sigma factor [Crocinitomix algicola]|uniref:RNA polymerase sigma factor n=1 Tax=Crocinitomix algicola TaxID=1740263 RepID=UPI00082ACEA5|nr:sigma-70 family RNA polymerase sigma factor [Crocinitomix algicola]